MKIIVCLDDKDGMLFNKRRQSSDCLLCQRMLEITEGRRIWMNAYSAKLFEDRTERVSIDEAFLEKCPEEEWCFVENADLTPYIDKIGKVVIYRWNRSYPRDKEFPAALLEKCIAPVSSFEFAGNSHEKITEEVYAL